LALVRLGNGFCTRINSQGESSFVEWMKPRQIKFNSIDSYLNMSRGFIYFCDQSQHCVKNSTKDFYKALDKAIFLLTG